MIFDVCNMCDKISVYKLITYDLNLPGRVTLL